MINNPPARSNRSRPREQNASHRESCNAGLTTTPDARAGDELNEEERHSFGPQIPSDISLRVEAPLPAPEAAAPLGIDPSTSLSRAIQRQSSGNNCPAATTTSRSADLPTCRNANMPIWPRNHHYSLSGRRPGTRNPNTGSGFHRNHHVPPRLCRIPRPNC